MQPGATLLHYRIVDKLGEGGMGVVWKALDTTLDREVAIKVLPAEFSADAERLARFEREAKLLASLNHPNIAGIYGIHEADGTRFLAMELVEGEDLAQRLARGPLPAAEAMAVAGRIADAVEAAHDRGIVHRDLKPANVKLAADGTVKVLDFGLAKAVESHPGDPSSLSVSPTVTSLGTMAGTILGTAAYMSPEQARGQEVDKRADVWAFGCVLYQMLVGRAPFGGDTLTDVLAAIVRGEPDWEALPTDAPPRLRRLLRRCLRKEPRERMRSVGDAGLILEEIARSDSDGDVIAPASTAPSTAAATPWKLAAAVFALAALLFAALWLLGGRAEPAKNTAARVTAMTLLTDLPGWQGFPSLSPDGNQLLFVAEDGGDKDIFLLRVGGENAINLTRDHPGADNHPAWSPDGQRIAFASSRDGGGIFVMGATGESPLRVSNEGFHPSWSPDGTKLMYCDEDIVDVFSRGVVSDLTVVDIKTGKRTVLPAKGDSVGGQWSPDGRLVAYWTSDNGQRDLRTIPADGSAPYVSITDDPAADWWPVWSPDGRWLYFLSDRGGSPDLWRIAIDGGTGEAAGPPESVTTGVANVVQASIAADGRRIALAIDKKSSSIDRLRFDPVRERPVGEAESFFYSNNELTQSSLSRDERWIAYRSTAPQDDLFIMQVDGSGRRRLTNDVARDRGPDWGPGDEWLAFYSNRAGSYDHYLIRRDGTGLRRLTGREDTDVNDPAWSRDGKRMAAVVFDPRGTAFYDVDPAWLDASTQIEPIKVETTVPDFFPRGWSPDDRRIVGDGPAVLDVASGRVEPLRRPDGSLFVSGLDAGWLDANRLILWDDDLSSAFVYDVERGESRRVDGIPGPSGFEVADGGRTLYLLRRIREADVWLLTLGE